MVITKVSKTFILGSNPLLPTINAMYTVYILQSIKTAGYYIGHCQDLPIRFQQHNAGKVRSTKHDRPWKVVRTEEYATKREAYARERKIKSYKGGEAFRRLLPILPE